MIQDASKFDKKKMKENQPIPFPPSQSQGPPPLHTRVVPVSITVPPMHPPLQTTVPSHVIGSPPSPW